VGERRFRVVDVGSLNSTYVNREPVDSAVLVNGDEVQIGKFRLTFLTKPKNHGGAGRFDLPLSPTSTSPTIEPRQGPSHAIIFTFNKVVTAGSATATEGVATVGVPFFFGNEMWIPLTGVPNQQYVTVVVSNVESLDGGSGGSASVRVGFLLGDVNQNRVVTLADLGLVNAQVAQFVNSANYLKDVNVSGTLSLADKAITNAQVTKALPPP